LFSELKTRHNRQILAKEPLEKEKIKKGRAKIV